MSVFMIPNLLQRRLQLGDAGAEVLKLRYATMHHAILPSFRILAGHLCAFTAFFHFARRAI
jgi:hypothetical protein